MNVSVGPGPGGLCMRVSSSWVCGSVKCAGGGGVRGAGRVCVCYSEYECTAECESVRVTARLWICVDLSGRVCVRVTAGV